jgi:uncharacterized protein (TIGR03083 family)
MGTRPLRQYYVRDGEAPLPVVVDPGFGLVIEPWRRHRARFLDELRALDDADWGRATRCEDWSVREVIGHLVVVDGYFPLPLTAARDRTPPTTYLAGFDPSSSTDDLVAATTSMSVGELLDQYVAVTDAMVTLVDSFAPADWDVRCESPLGHLPARFVLGHAFWDSWLHEYDILTQLDRAPAFVDDELLGATWFSLWFAGLQGGIVDDPDPVGPGPEAPIECCLRFSDLPDRALHVAVGTPADGVRVMACGPDHRPVDAGRAVDVVEGLAGRAPVTPAVDALPEDLAAQLQRAALVF